MSKRPRDSVKARRICVDTHSYIGPLGRKYMDCHVCKLPIDLVNTKPSDWRADHIKRHAEGGGDTPDNLWPICIDCDAGADGKAAEDTKAVAKGKRMGNRHDGVKVPGRAWR